MARITHTSAFLIEIPVEKKRTDAVQAFVKQETIFCQITTDEGQEGLGYSYTIGNGGTSVLSLLTEQLLPQLIGQDPSRLEACWYEMFDSTRATTVGAITSLALAAADIALWDLKCRTNDTSLWREVGGFAPSRPVYDTEGGWIHLDIEELAAGAKQAIELGFGGVKVKVGKPQIGEDAERIGAVRDAIGPDKNLMVDANQAMTYPRAKRLAAALEPYDLSWLEEPLPADDLTGHRRLADSTSIPIAVGESMYSVGHFAQYLMTGAVGIVQADVARVGGITPWLKIAHLAEACNIKVSPHFLMELHVSLASGVPNGLYVEHIPQLRSITNTAIEIVDGRALAPDQPGLGIDWNHDAIDDLRVA